MSAGAYDVEGDALRQVRKSTNALVDATPERALGSSEFPSRHQYFRRGAQWRELIGVVQAEQPVEQTRKRAAACRCSMRNDWSVAVNLCRSTRTQVVLGWPTHVHLVGAWLCQAMLARSFFRLDVLRSTGDLSSEKGGVLMGASLRKALPLRETVGAIRWGRWQPAWRR